MSVVLLISCMSVCLTWDFDARFSTDVCDEEEEGLVKVVCTDQLTIA